MIIPVRCFTCGKLLADKMERYQELVRSHPDKTNDENIITIDGVRVKNNFGWWLIRASNTEESIIIRFEGKSIKDKKESFIIYISFL